MSGDLGSAPTAGVACATRDAAVAGAAVALAARAGGRTATALLLTWSGGVEIPAALAGPAAPAARRLASAMSARGHDGVTAAGFLVHVPLPADEAEAAAAARHAAVAAPGAAVVVVAATARGAGFDAILEDQAWFVAVSAPGAPAEVAELARATAAVPEHRVHSCVLQARAGERALLKLGLVLPRSMATALAPIDWRLR